MNPSIQSFVIRIWIEETAEESGETVWRGHITHVESRNRTYFTRLGQILDTVAAYLEEMNIPVGRTAQSDRCPEE